MSDSSTNHDDGTPIEGDEPSLISTRPRFAPVPQEMLFDPEMSGDAVKLWGILDRIAARERIFPGRAKLAAIMGCSEDTIDRWTFAGAVWVARTSTRYMNGRRSSGVKSPQGSPLLSPQGCGLWSPLGCGTIERKFTERKIIESKGRTPLPPIRGARVFRPIRLCLQSRGFPNKNRLKIKSASRLRKVPPPPRNLRHASASSRRGWLRWGRTRRRRS